MTTHQLAQQLLKIRNYNIKDIELRTLPDENGMTLIADEYFLAWHDRQNEYATHTDPA